MNSKDKLEFPLGEALLSGYVSKHAQDMPDKAAINYYGREITFKELDNSSDRLATAIADMGYKKGDRMVAFMQNCPQIHITYLAAMKLGLIIVPIDPMHKEFEVEYSLNDSGVTLLVTFDQLYPIVKNVRDRTKLRDVIVTSFHDYLPDKPTISLHKIMKTKKQMFPDTLEFLDLLEKYPPNPPKVDVTLSDDAWILYTGGTTGLPKGCLHRQGDALFSGYGNSVLFYRATKDDILLSPVPHTHISGISTSLCASFFSGLTVILLARWDAIAAMEAIQQYKVTLAMWPAPCYYDVINHPEVDNYDLTSLRLSSFFSFAMHITKKLSDKWCKITKCSIDHAGYDAGSENFNYGTYATGLSQEEMWKEPAARAIGMPKPGVEFKIKDFETGEEVLIGKEGEICQKSPSMIRKYWNKPKETKKALDDSGFFHTGDRGKIGENGVLYWYDREKDIIKVSGYTLAPREIEVWGLRNPAINQIAVIGVPHPRKGTIPKAFVTLKPDAKTSTSELEEWFKEHIAAYKVPVVEIRESLPISGKGEILRRQLLQGELEKQK